MNKTTFDFFWVDAKALFRNWPKRADCGWRRGERERVGGNWRERGEKEGEGGASLSKPIH